MLKSMQLKKINKIIEVLSNGTDNMWPFPCRISKLKHLIKVPPWKT